jgi:hypothetical protein
VLTIFDEIYINAAKKVWYNFIEKDRNTLIEHLLEKKKQFLEKHKAGKFNEEGWVNADEYTTQFDEYIALLMEINIHILDECRTMLEIINVWPELVTPQPPYTYGN